MFSSCCISFLSKMLKLAVIFALFTFALGSPCFGSNSTCSDGKFSCDPSETECALGCCPIQDAVCCSDGYECCPPGTVCVPYVGVCISVDSSSGKPELKSEEAVATKQTVSACPPGTTTCPAGCCPFENAVCCSDKLHCCPNGYKCTDVACVKSSDNLLLRKIAFIGKKPFFQPQKTVLKVCPGGNHRCPTEKNCCINDDGLWECCDKPSLAKVKDNCCDTVMGHTCCPDYLVCTYYGCL
ncbi:progranulin-like isoform X2 [Stegodyphus dumicola]|uniref:progranulin-like isoform X2 n=1 Tax=Stegodyphus dumicola TaxID=202533 RepID=UPI0015A77813|nr:progranulin-like isoform X2 [Stegodyphus dumicola]